MTVDLGLQMGLALRLLFAAVLGALIGLEREVHEHPAGMRTHVLLAVGAGLFAQLSMYGFADVVGRPDVTLDPSRVAAQIVSGIGFLGGGAIIKYGTSIRGLTTAASLWATAAVGFATGSGLFVLALAGTAIIIFSLWPLNLVVDRLRIGKERTVRVRLMLAKLEALGAISRELTAHRVEIAAVQSQRVGTGRYEVELDLRLPIGVRPEALVAIVTAFPDVELIESSPAAE